MVVLYLGLIDLDLSSCLVVSPPLPPAPPSISGSCSQERTPRASLPGCESQKLGGGEEAAPPLLDSLSSFSMMAADAADALCSILHPHRFSLLFLTVTLSSLPAPTAALLGVRPEDTQSGELSVQDGILKATEGTRFMLRVYYSASPATEHPNNLNTSGRPDAAPWIAFIEEPGGDSGDAEMRLRSRVNPCEEENARSSDIELLGSFRSTSSQNSVLVELLAKDLRRGEVIKYYSMCAFDGVKWEHFSTKDFWLAVVERPPETDVWLQAGVSVLLLALSALCSGLNISMLALDPVELRVLQNSGTEKEQKYARKIESVRKHGNYILCTVVLGNVLTNTCFVVWMCQILGMTVLSTASCTLGIFFIGEILPHSVASRHSLAIASKTLCATRLLMLAFFPIAYPVSKILDIMLHQEISNFYTREKLVAMLRVTDPYHDLVKEELNIIQGALELRTKTVEDVLTPLSDCYMLSSDAVLDFCTMSDVMQSGFTRIPVYENDRSNIVDILFVKDLAFVDPDDCTPLKTITQFYKHPMHCVFNDTKLDVMLEEFKRANSYNCSPDSVTKGRVEVEIGKEALRFENGAFSYYGMPALIPPLPVGQRYSSRASGLNQSDLLLSGGSVGQLATGGGVYLPDYSVRQLTDLQIIKITKNHYQNALMATRMDSSPQTPDPVDADAKGRPPVPEARSHSIALPLTHTHTRLGLARLAHLHPHGGLRNTSQLNERNRIVRSKSDGQRSPNDTVFLRMDEIPYIHEDRTENYGEDDVPTESHLSTSPFISSLSLSGSDDNIGKKLLRKLSNKRRKKSRDGEKSLEEGSDQLPVLS
ncbi:Metal transporter CNNM1 [Collichthys lucidus]|uniref:Metal transporter n=1 Tax=Collichthys lucidus TaxID=240159 RepID=A0A4U5VBX0_COLLU|nr:Metal transporter CNNM1 [Collichthys lucidus]